MLDRRFLMNPIIVIPSRMASTRLPGKPLAAIGGLPMIAHVVRAAQAAAIGPVVVAAADQAIADALAGMDVTVIMTAADLPSGSDRVCAAVDAVDPAQDHDVVINLQGDLPLFAPQDLRRVLLPLAEGRFDLSTLVAPVRDEAEATTASVVKAVCAFDTEARVARALYFSRAAVPSGPGPLWHHVGVYGWRRQALKRFVALPPSPLEQRESLEQLRALENGMTIGCAVVDHAPHGVDTPADLEKVRMIMAERGN